MKVVTYLLALVVGCVGTICHGQSSTGHQHQHSTQAELHWHKDFEKAHSLSQRTGKPLFILFTGSDWCTWCKKLEREVFETREFKAALSDKLIFVVADFPMRNKQPQRIQQQNKRLQRQFDVEGFPTVLCLDPDLNQIAVMGYRRGGGQSYANYVLNILKEYDELAWQMKSLNNGVFDVKELEEMYGEAQQAGHDDYSAAILGAGLKADNNTFFLIEKYRQLSEADKGNTAEAQEIRQQLLSTENKDRVNSSYRVAVIDFQALSDQHKNDNDPSIVLAPLLSYVQEFGDSNSETLWKVHMMISQVYSSKEQWEDALQHAEQSQAKAPESFKQEVQGSIDFIKSKIS